MDSGCPGLRELDSKVLGEFDNPVINPLEGRFRFLRLPPSCFQFLIRFLKPREGCYELRAHLSQSLRTNRQAGEEVAKDRGRLLGLPRKCGAGVGPGTLSGVGRCVGPGGASTTGRTPYSRPAPGRRRALLPMEQRWATKQHGCRQSRDEACGEGAGGRLR